MTTTLEGSRPEPMTPQELGKKSFNTFESIKRCLIGLKNPALRNALFKKEFSGNAKKGISFDINGSTFVFEVNEAVIESEKDQEGQNPVILHSRRVLITKTADGNSSSINLSTSWQEEHPGIKDFKLGGVKVIHDKTAYTDSEEAYEKIHEVLGDDLYPIQESQI